MDNKTSNIYEVIQALKLRTVLESVLVGAIAGLIVSLYRLVLKYFGGYGLKAYEFMGTHKIYIILGLIVLLIIGYAVGLILKHDPMIGGSGIPQIEGLLKGYFDIKNPVKVLIGKFVGGVLAIGAGLSLGIEGPSIQLGASVAHIYGNITKRLKLEKRFLISAASGAGLAAAFNAPFAGVMFVLEEVHRSFSPILFVSAISACVSSDLVTWIFFGGQPILDVHKLLVLPYQYYILLIILGIIVGVCGALYNSTLLKTIDIYKKINVSLQVRMMIPFAIVLIFGLYLPEVLGGGNDLINHILVNGVVLKFAVILLVGKFILSMTSFASGIPGGILFPLLTLGALVGVIFGQVSMDILGGDSGFIINFILLAMAGMFASIVRAPITGLVLVCEMSGSFTQLGPLAVVCGVAYLVADLLGSEPVYESLLKLRIAYQKNDNLEKDAGKSVVEYVVDLGSPIVGKRLKMIKLVDNALVITVKTAGEEIIPNGNTIIRAGDTITALVDEGDESNLREQLESLCKLS
ncbi:ClC family H(+)/Cl(-) exchange transporter [Clostridium sardiniense]|uniref:ClC family H(+)/Cl(-) exchange transporter n=1 Tax=Clostridium sardiniense TaxID=29369 RepID=UPI003D343D64